MWIVAVVAGAIGLYLLHRLALWLERRGWLFYRDRRSSTGALGGIFSEVNSILDPRHRYVIEEQVKEAQAEDDSGDPPDPWTPSRTP